MARKKKRKELAKKPTVTRAESSRIIWDQPPLEKPVTIPLLLLILILAFGLYGVSLDFGFVLDDKIVLSENNFTKQGLKGIPELFSTDSFQGYFGEQKNILQGGRYRPLSLVSFAIEYQLFGLNPLVFHLGNILVYAFSIFIAFVGLRRLFRENPANVVSLFSSAAFVTALLFMIHPIHTEAVANIKGRDELLSFLFSMLGLLFGLRYYDRKSWLSLVWCNLFFLLGLFSKENTLTFLAIIPFAVLLFRKLEAARILMLVASLFLTSLIYMAIRIKALGYLFLDNPSTDIMNNPFVNLDFAEKYATIAYTLLMYIKLNFIPIELTHDYYPFHIPVMNFSDWQVWLSILIHLTMVVGVFYFWKRKPKISFALGFYLAALSIVSNIVVNVGTFMNERFAFAASLGMCLLMALALLRLKAFSSDRFNFAFPLILGLLFAAFSFKTFDRVFAWENELTLNQEAIKVSKNSARANSFTATAYFNKYKETQDREEKKELLRLARPYAERAVELYPQYLNANLMLAGIFAEEYKYDGRLDKLLAGFREVAGRRPDVEFLTTYLKYLNDRGNNIDELTRFYLDLGYNELYQQQKRYDWAIHYLLLGDSISPNNPEIYAALAEAYRAFGRNDLAQKYSQPIG